MMAKIAILSTHMPTNISNALVTALGISIANENHLNQYDFLLAWQDTDVLCLVDIKKKIATKPFFLNFNSDSLSYRRKVATLKKEKIAKAIGIKPKDNALIIDATAGLARDSFILASLGFEVTMLERSQILVALLQNAMTRATKEITLKPIISRMHLINCDALDYLAGLKSLQKPAVIYLDPMFPHREKSASVKKEMRLLQALVAESEDGALLFEMALTCAMQRVVVKRPRLAPSITERKPSYSLTGASCRFDVYLT